MRLDHTHLTGPSPAHIDARDRDSAERELLDRLADLSQRMPAVDAARVAFGSGDE